MSEEEGRAADTEADVGKALKALMAEVERQKIVPSLRDLAKQLELSLQKASGQVKGLNI